MRESEIVILVSERGVVQVQIHGDSSQEKSTAHLLLARVQPQMDALDRALKAARQVNQLNTFKISSPSDQVNPCTRKEHKD